MTTTQSTSDILANLIEQARRRPSAAARRAILAAAKLPLAAGEMRTVQPTEQLLLRVWRLAEGEFYVECSREGEVLNGLSGTKRDERDALRSFAALVLATL